MEKFFRHPWIIVAVITVITVFFTLQLFRAELDNNNLRFVPKNDRALITSDRIDDTFGSSLFVLVALERKYGTVFEGEFLNRLRDFVRRVEEIEVTGDVSSLISTDYITGKGDSIVVEKLVGEDFSGSVKEVAELERRVLSWEMYDRSLVSDDFTATQVLVPLNISSGDAGRPESVDSFMLIRNMAREMFKDLAVVYVTGMPVICATINEAVHADLVLLVPLVLLVVLAVLLFSFHRFTAVALPLLTVVAAATWSIGAMPLCGVKLSVISTILPVILVAVGSAYGIHVITHYISDMGDRVLSPEEHRALVFALLRKIGKPVFLAALTTFTGFFSFCFTPVAPIREFGIFSSLGVLTSFIVAVTLIPSLLLIRGPKPLWRASLKKRKAGGKTSAARGNDVLSGMIAEALVHGTQGKYSVIILTVGITLVSLYGLSRVIIDNVMVEYFKPHTDIYRSDVFIREKFGGSKLLSVVLEADDSETLLHPDSLNALEGLNLYLSEKVPQVGKVMGFTDLVKRINQVFNVDESPGGLRAAVSAGGGAGESGFGFDGAADGDFGFSGFSSFDEGAADPAETGAPDAAEPPAGRGAKIYTEAELIALFDEAEDQVRARQGRNFLWELKRLVNYDGAAYYEIPSDPEKYGKSNPEELQRLVSNYLVLLSGNIDQYANDPLEPTAIKSTVQLKTVGQYDSGAAYRAMIAYIKANFPPNLKTTIGGVTAVEVSLNRLVVQSQISSVIISIIIVFIIITISNRSLAAGAIGIIPLSISILTDFAVMGFAGIKLNIGTSMVASVSVGIGIDYTIHYLDAFKREYRRAGGRAGVKARGPGEFLYRSFVTSGKAILINAVSVGAGFAVLLLSQFSMLADLGLLIALTMLTSALVSLTLLPVLLMLFYPKFLEQPEDIPKHSVFGKGSSLRSTK
ncbi:MAG: MMPL family transporter [Treponema sp.]|jgi:predicted RND superfamily exporter protein|nr:MMPL family transporter [Treponema sp.]